jgi:uncharacterized protein with GYD domain
LAIFATIRHAAFLRRKVRFTPESELSAMALNLSLSALGNIRTESLRAFSSTDMFKIVAKML